MVVLKILPLKIILERTRGLLEIKVEKIIYQSASLPSTSLIDHRVAKLDRSKNVWQPLPVA